MAQVTFHPLQEVADPLIKFAVIAARYQGKWVFCRHRERTTWEIPGGHREPGETPLETARRELYEETGATEADISVVGCYRLNDYGLLCFAEIKELGPIPETSEIGERQLFELAPTELTYGAVHAQLFEWVQGWLNMQSNAGELWDIYDENRNLTERTHRRGDFLAKGDYHLVVHIWIQNSRGEYLITKRCPNKGFPNMWECTGGSALAGDDSLTAALREVREETGLELDPEKGKRVITYRGTDHFSDVWLFRQDCDLKDVMLQEGETCDKMYASKGEILQMLQDGTFVPISHVHQLLQIGERTFVEGILSRMGYGSPLAVTQFQNEEDGGFYNVWRVDYPDQSFVLKRAKGQELSHYRRWFAEPASFAPRLYAATEDYMLMEYVPGNNLMKCSRDDLILALDSLIKMQKKHWDPTPISIPQNRLNRREYLRDPRLEAAYDAYLKIFSQVPGTLCHDDLLPFNVVISDGRAVFIDWEVAGILPYPTSLARLIAHCEEDENTLFYMEEEDKKFAISYYYQHFIAETGIPREEFDCALDLCLLYEYCEWVYVGHKFEATDTDRFRQYYGLATRQAEKLGF